MNLTDQHSDSTLSGCDIAIERTDYVLEANFIGKRVSNQEQSLWSSDVTLVFELFYGLIRWAAK